MQRVEIDFAKKGHLFLSYNEEASKEKNCRTLKIPMIPNYLSLYFWVPDFKLAKPTTDWLKVVESRNEH